MKFLLDFFPLIAFLLAFNYPEEREQGIYYATYALMAASIVQIALSWLIYKKVEKMHLVTLVVVMIAGGLTIALHDDRFIRWKPTIVFWGFALVTLGSQFLRGKNIYRGMLQMADDSIKMPDKVWFHLNMAWAVFFIFCGCLNLYAAFVLFADSIDKWVDFKVWGLTILNFVFIIGQTIYMWPYLKEHSQESDSGED